MYWIKVGLFYDMTLSRGKSDYDIFALNIFDEDINLVEKSFLEAAWDGDIKKIETLISKRRSLVFNIDARDSLGNTALLRSISNHHYQISKLLIKHGCDVTVTNKNHDSLVTLSAENCVALLLDSWTEGSANIQLCRACWLANVQLVNSLLKHDDCNVNCRNIDGLTPLLLLVCGLKTFNSVAHLLNSSYTYSPLDTLISLIKNGCDINAVETVSNFGAVHFLASYDNAISCQMMNILLKNRYNIDVRDVNEQTGLHISAQNGNLSMLKLLISNSVSINSTDSHLNTSLHYAAKSGQLLIASYLLSIGANLNATNDEGLTPLDIAPQTSTCRSLLAKAMNMQNDDASMNRSIDIAKKKFSSKNERKSITELPEINTPDVQLENKLENNAHFSNINSKEDSSEKENTEKYEILELENKFCIESTWLNKSSDSGCPDITPFDSMSSYDSNKSYKYNLSPLHVSKDLFPNDINYLNSSALNEDVFLNSEASQNVNKIYSKKISIKKEFSHKKVAFDNSSLDLVQMESSINEIEKMAIISPSASIDLKDLKLSNNLSLNTSINTKEKQNPKFMNIKYTIIKSSDVKTNSNTSKSKYSDICDSNKQFSRCKEPSFFQNKFINNSKINNIDKRIINSAKSNEKICSSFLNRFQLDNLNINYAHFDLNKGPIIIDPFESLKLRREMERDTQDSSPQIKLRPLSKQITITKSSQIKNKGIRKGLGAKTKSSGDLISEDQIEEVKVEKKSVNANKKKVKRLKSEDVPQENKNTEILEANLSEMEKNSEKVFNKDKLELNDKLINGEVEFNIVDINTLNHQINSSYKSKSNASIKLTKTKSLEDDEEVWKNSSLQRLVQVVSTLSLRASPPLLSPSDLQSAATLSSKRSNINSNSPRFVRKVDSSNENKEEFVEQNIESTDRTNYTNNWIDSQSESRFGNRKVIEWRKGNLLGKGAYGMVWCGLTNQGGLIAVKTIDLNIADFERAEQEYAQVQQEVNLLKTLEHSNIVGYLGTSLEECTVCIFMEFISGGSIASLLARFGALDEQLIANYTQQILQGIAYLHKNHIIHRDIKGGNIMLTQNGVIKLIDFGCAKKLCCSMAPLSNSNLSTLMESMRGTPYWMAPEVVRQEKHDTKSDIWSVGCTLYEMATKYPPWSDYSPAEAIFAIGSDSTRRPRLPDKFSNRCRQFYKLCLTREHTARPSALTLLTDNFLKKAKTNYEAA